MGTILYCRLCGTGYGSTGEVPEKCPTCKRETRWTTSPQHGALTADGIKWALSVEDRRFLRSLRIAQE